MSEDFKPFSKRVGQALVSLFPAYSKMHNLDMLRKEGTLNITLNPERLALPAQDLTQLDLLARDKMYTWVAYSLLFCPDELAAPGALDLCRVILGQVQTLFSYNETLIRGNNRCCIPFQAYRTPVFRNISIPIHNFYSEAWKNYKSKTFKLGKEKKIIVDGLQAATAGQGLIGTSCINELPLRNV